MWIIAPEVVRRFGDLKRPERAIGTGPFLLERYEPTVKTVFKRNPEYFLKDQSYVDEVEWLSLEVETMKRSTDRILTTHVGSLVRPPGLVELMRTKENGQAYDQAALAARVQSAVRDVV